MESGSPAVEAGLRRGDVIEEVNRHSVRNLYDYNGALAKAKWDRTALLLVKRGGGTLYVVLKSASKSRRQSSGPLFKAMAGGRPRV